MNWKLIFGLSLFGLAMGLATTYVVPSTVEPFFWLAIFLLSAFLIATRARGDFFLHGLLLGLANSVWITGVHLLLFHRYAADHAAEMKMMAGMPLSHHPRLLMALMGPVIGFVSGVVLGVFAMIAARLVRNRPRAAAAGIAIGAALLLTGPRSAIAQRAQFGGLVGYSIVGGNDSRTASDHGLGPVTGGDQAGLHLRVLFDVPMNPTLLTFRTELFYNRLTSGPNSFALTGEGGAQAARVDQTVGLTESFVGTTSRTAGIAPYFSLGAGVFASTLRYKPDGTTTVASATLGGMGMGLVAGAGLRIRMGGPDLLIDWRYFQGLNHTRGSAFMPLALGLVW